MDLSDLFLEIPATSPRKVLWLIESLPMECMTIAILRDAEDSFGWDSNAYLLASVIDAVRDNTFTNMQVRTKKRLKPFDPVRVPGLGSKKKEKPVSQFVRMAQAAYAKQS